MAQTNFAALTSHQKKVWVMEFWKQARNASFISQFAGMGENAMVQRIKELTKTERGDLAVITLVADMITDGIGGDNELEDNEEALQSYDTQITIDQLRNANRTTGKLADQQSIVKFREQSRDKLAYWLAERIDQLAFLVMSGVSLALTNKGAARATATFANLAFAADVTPPSAERHLRWDNANGVIAPGDTSLVEADDVLTYNCLVQAKAHAKDNFVRGIKGPAGQEIYHVFTTPKGMARLKQDPDFRENLRHAAPRSNNNPLFVGANSYMLDGMIVHEYRNVYSNVNAGVGNKWGAASDVDGQRVLMCGAQGLAMADIGPAEWEEDQFDYKNQKGIAIGKIFGFLKPVFHSTVTGDDQDFGIICIDTAI